MFYNVIPNKVRVFTFASIHVRVFTFASIHKIMIERCCMYYLPCLLLLGSCLGDRFSQVCDMPGELKKKDVQLFKWILKH